MSFIRGFGNKPWALKRLLTPIDPSRTAKRSNARGFACFASGGKKRQEKGADGLLAAFVGEDGERDTPDDWCGGQGRPSGGVDGPKTKQAGIMHAMCPAGDALRSRIHIMVNNGEWRTAEIVINYFSNPEL